MSVGKLFDQIAVFMIYTHQEHHLMEFESHVTSQQENCFWPP
jgi:hypothetical protein